MVPRSIGPRRMRSVVLLAALAWSPACLHAATIAVTTSSGAVTVDGLCSLPEAITAANDDLAFSGCSAGQGADRIVFAISLPATIQLAVGLPDVTETVRIQGPGASSVAIDGQDLHQLFRIDSVAGGEWLGVAGVTLIRGLAPEHGGAVSVAPGETAWTRQVVFVDNQATNGGGGLAVEGGAIDAASATVDECWFDGNTALGPTGGGGLLALGPNATVVIDRTTISGNHADHGSGIAGGILVNRADVTLERSTVSGNVAAESGGGLYVLASTANATLRLHDSTVTANQAEADGDTTGEGGGIYVSIGVGPTATLEMRNSILAENLDSGVLVQPDVALPASTTLASLGFNLVGSNEGGAAVLAAGAPNGDGDWVGTAAAPIDPEIEALASNGGFGPDHRPAAIVLSPVIDKGSCPGIGSDQRGYGDVAAHLRRFDVAVVPDGAGSDTCDIGSHERAGDPGADPDLFADGFETGHTLLWDAEAP